MRLEGWLSAEGFRFGLSFCFEFQLLHRRTDLAFCHLLYPAGAKTGKADADRKSVV